MSAIQTERLVLSPYTQDDFENFSILRGDASIMTSMVAGPVYGAAAELMFAAYLSAWKHDGLGVWAIRDRENMQFVGECGFWDRKGDVGLTIRYLLHKQYWGCGFAAEAVAECVKYGLEIAKIKSLSAVALKENARSCAILERIGMTMVDENHQGIPGFRHYVLPVNSRHVLERPSQ